MMLRSLWRSIDRFSLHYFRYIINELRKIKVVDELNRASVVDILQSIVEIVTYGDRHDPSIFECFMEHQVLADFVRVLKISRNSGIEAPLLQYLSIMIQNMDSDHAIYYCFSNDHINSIISHQFEFNAGDLAQFYVSFLRTVSSKINRDTIWLFVKVHKDDVVSFPLYSGAVKFAYHEEKMIQTAIRVLTLNIYSVSDDLINKFLSTPPTSQYFSDLMQSIKGKCINLDACAYALKESCSVERRKELLMESDKIVDDFYYIKDILCIGKSCLNKLVTENLLTILVFPILVPLVQLNHSSGSKLSPVTSLYVVSRLLQVVDVKTIGNPVASVILYPCVASSLRDAADSGSIDSMSLPNSLFDHLDEMKGMGCSKLDSGVENINSNFLHNCLLENNSPHMISWTMYDTYRERCAIFAYLFSENHGLMLASLMLLVILAECQGLDYLLDSLGGLYQVDIGTQKMMILHALLKILESQSPPPVLVQLHASWFLLKLVASLEKKLNASDIHLFNASYEQSCVRLLKELDRCWFDYIPDTLSIEWESCKTALEEPAKSKDPFFLLELDFSQEVSDGEMISSLSCKRMIDAVKVFILHHQLRSFIIDGKLLENPLISLSNGSLVVSERTHASACSSAALGSELALGSGIPCKITFSEVGMKDIHLMPMVREISGNLLLVEEHPYHNRQGVVIAVAPLAALGPVVDENHPTWLHLHIRDFDPRLNARQLGRYGSNVTKHVAGQRWTVGFPNADACQTARTLLLKEISKQRSFVERLIASLLPYDFPISLLKT